MRWGGNRTKQYVVLGVCNLFGRKNRHFQLPLTNTKSQLNQVVIKTN